MNGLTGIGTGTRFVSDRNFSLQIKTRVVIGTGIISNHGCVNFGACHGPSCTGIVTDIGHGQIIANIDTGTTEIPNFIVL